MSEKMTTSEPTTGEIVRVLHHIIDDEQELFGHTQVIVNIETIRNAADRLESQERDIETLRAFHERYAEQTSKKYVEEICALTARAEQAETREKAAIADMKLIVDNVRETHCDETCCFACKYDCDISTNDSGVIENECLGFDKDDCFEWRGAQEGEG